MGPKGLLRSPEKDMDKIVLRLPYGSTSLFFSHRGRVRQLLVRRLVDKVEAERDGEAEYAHGQELDEDERAKALWGSGSVDRRDDDQDAQQQERLMHHLWRPDGAGHRSHRGAWSTCSLQRRGQAHSRGGAARETRMDRVGARPDLSWRKIAFGGGGTDCSGADAVP